MFDADRPIQCSQEDRLGRATFAKYLARCILDQQSPESLAIGLYGSWGTGKTSIINLMVEELRFAASNMEDNQKPIILNFSPWSYSGHEQLIYAFFRRLSAVIRQFPYLENQDQIVSLLELYVSFFTHKPVPAILRKKKSFMAKILNFDNATTQIGWESGRDLTQIKAELNQLLIAQQHKIIIIIDNISRIDPQEVKQIFQILKSIGDYANTIYILSADKEQLKKMIGDDSESYLEKIIQLSFDLPMISQHDLEIILLEKLDIITQSLPQDVWNKDYWGNIYYACLKYFFVSFRDITRYLNILNFGFNRIKTLVNPVDFFAITALQVFESDIFYGIRDNKDLFTNLVNDVYMNNHQKIVEDRLRCDEIISRAKRAPADLIKQLLIQIFPRLNIVYALRPIKHDTEEKLRMEKRICISEIFDICFRLSIPIGFIPETEFDAILASANNEAEFSQSLLRLNQDGRIKEFLDLLDSTAIQQIDKNNIAHVVNALIDGGDLFPAGENTAVIFDTLSRMYRIIHRLLLRTNPDEEKTHILSDAINHTTNSLYSIIYEINAVEKENTRIDISRLKHAAVEKIKFWASINRLEEHPKLLLILIAWKSWDASDACNRFVKKITETDKGLLLFLKAALAKPIQDTMIKLEKTPQWKEYLSNITLFIPTDEIENHAIQLFENEDFEKLTEEEQLAILIFLDLVNAKTSKVIPKTTV